MAATALAQASADAAVSRAFHAAFFAAETALLVLGETRAQHSDVVSAFTRRVVRERNLDPRAGRLLRALSNRLVGILHGCLKTRTLYDEATAWSYRATTSKAA